jgi:hypothetical protein
MGVIYLNVDSLLLTFVNNHKGSKGSKDMPLVGKTAYFFKTSYYTFYEVRMLDIAY